MRRQRAPYANRTVWYAVAILAVVVVVGFAGAAYEINHLRTEVNAQGVRINGLNDAIALFRAALLQLSGQIK